MDQMMDVKTSSWTKELCPYYSIMKYALTQFFYYGFTVLNTGAHEQDSYDPRFCRHFRNLFFSCHQTYILRTYL
jgi:hypothetical protein